MMRRLFAGLAALAIAAAAPAVAQETLTVWWAKGFYKSEDDALFAVIKKFEEKTGVKVELSQYPPQESLPKTVAALDAGTPPDVVMLLRNGMAYCALFSTRSTKRKSNPPDAPVSGTALMNRTPPVFSTPVSVTASLPLHALTAPAARHATES